MKKLKDFIAAHFEGALLILILLGVCAIALLVHYKFSFLNFFFLPVILSGYFLGRRRAVLTAILCVLVIVLYLIYFDLLSGSQEMLNLDAIINLAVWGCFLILTGTLIGSFSDQRASKIQKLKEAYIGGLEVMFKYLECADEVKPSSLRVASLAGKIADAAGLETNEEENIKSAALLSATEDLESSLPLFVEMTDFLRSDFEALMGSLEDREKVAIKATSSLLEEVEPILNSFIIHYVQEADRLDKDLHEIPFGSSILALAHIYDRIFNKAAPFQGKEEYKSLVGVQGLAGRAFPAPAVKALMQVVSSL